jgi:hypothetical protein
LHHLHPSEVEVLKRDGSKATLRCGDPCVNPVLGGGAKRFIYVHKKGQTSYSIAADEVPGIMNTIRTQYPGATLASRDDVVDMANADKSFCACGWTTRSRTDSRLTTVYPSIPGTSGGCGGGQRAAISCGDAGPSWSSPPGRAGVWVNINPREPIATLRSKLDAKGLTVREAPIEYNVGGGSGPEAVFDGNLATSYHNKYVGFPYALEDHFLNLVISDAQVKALEDIDRIVIHHAHGARARAEGVVVEVRARAGEGGDELWRGRLSGQRAIYEFDKLWQWKANVASTTQKVREQCLLACSDKCGDEEKSACEARCGQVVDLMMDQIKTGTLPPSDLQLRNEIANAHITCLPPPPVTILESAPKPMSREQQITQMLSDPNAPTRELNAMMEECSAKGRAEVDACSVCSGSSKACDTEDKKRAAEARCAEAKRQHGAEACRARLEVRKAEIDRMKAEIDAYCRATYNTTCDKIPNQPPPPPRAGSAPSIPNELTIYFDENAKDIVYGDKLLEYSEGEPDVDWRVGDKQHSGQGGYGFLAKGYRMYKGKVANTYTGVIVNNNDKGDQATWKERALQDARYGFNFPMQFWPVRNVGEGLPTGAVLPNAADETGEQLAQFRVRTQMRTVNFEVSGYKDSRGREHGWWGYQHAGEWLKYAYAWAGIAAVGLFSGISHAGIWIAGAACNIGKGVGLAGCAITSGGCYAGCGIANAYCETKKGTHLAWCETEYAVCANADVGSIAAAVFDGVCRIGNPPYPCNPRSRWRWNPVPAFDWCDPQGFHNCRNGKVNQWLQDRRNERRAHCDSEQRQPCIADAHRIRSECGRGCYESCENHWRKCTNDLSQKMTCDVSSAHRWATKLVTDTVDELWPVTRDANPDGLIGVEVERFGTVARFQSRQNLPCLKLDTNQVKCLPCEVNGGGPNECAKLASSETIPNSWLGVFHNGNFKDGVNLAINQAYTGALSTSNKVNDLFPCPMPEFVHERGAANIPHDIMSSLRVHSNSNKQSSISQHPYQVEAPGWAGPRCDTPNDTNKFLKAPHCNESMVGTFEYYFSGQRDTVDKNFYTCAYKSGAVSTAQDLDRFVGYFQQGHVAECCDPQNCWFVPHNATVPFLQGMPQDFAANLIANFHNRKVRKASALCEPEKDAMVASIDIALKSARMDGNHPLLKTELRNLKSTILNKPVGTTCAVRCGV